MAIIACPTNDDKPPKPYALAMLSSIAAMTSEGPSEELNLRKEECRSSDIIPIEKESFGGHKSGGLKRSLSRSVSTRNLQQAMEFPSSSSWSHSDNRKEQRQSQEFGRGKRARIGFRPYKSCTIPLTQVAPLVASSKSAPTVRQNEKVPTKLGFEKLTAPLSGAPNETFGKRESSTDATKNRGSPDELITNIYRCHEMKLPDCCAIGPLPDSADNAGNVKAKVVDDYNYEIYTCNPLQDPPRLPSAMESIIIAERSMEEKNTWGWYA